MKSIIILLVFLCQLNGMSQGFELKRVKADIGKGSLTSGYDVSLIFKNANTSFSVVGNHTRVYAVYAADYEWVIPAISAGFYKNAPWIGPRVSLNPFSFVTLMSWYAVSAGEPEHPSTKMNLFIQYNGIFVTLWKLTFSGSMCKFMAEKTDYYPGVAYSDQLNSTWNYKVSVDYDVNYKEPLFIFGLAYSIE